MATTIYTQDGTPLTESRELGLLRPSLHGVYEGIRPTAGSSGFKVSILPGSMAINGVLIKEDTEFTDLFDLGTSGDNRHFQFYAAYYPGDAATDPLQDAFDGVSWSKDDSAYNTGDVYYSYVEGDFASPADVIDEFENSDNVESAKYVVVLGDLYIPGGASDFTSTGVRMPVPDVIPTPEKMLEDVVSGRTHVSIQNLTNSTSFGVGNDPDTHTLSWKNMEVIHLQEGAEFGIEKTEVTGSVSGSSDYDYELEIDYDGSNDTLIFLYTRTGSLEYILLDADAMEDSGEMTDTLYRALKGDSGQNASGDDHPARPEIDNIVPIGFYRDYGSSTLIHFFGGAIYWGHPIKNGRNTGYARGLKSPTVYSSSWPADTSDGYIDIEEVIPNLATIAIIGLDEAYDGVEHQSPAGDGRVIDVDAGPIELNHTLVNPPSTSDFPWGAPLVIDLISGSEEDRRVGVDVQSKHTDPQEGLGYRYRAPGYMGAYALNNLTYTVEEAGGTVLFKPEDNSGVGVITASRWESTHPDFTDAFAQLDFLNKFIVTFRDRDDNGNTKRAYQVKWASGNTYLHLARLDETTSGLASEIGVGTGFSGQCDIWFPHAEIGRVSTFDGIRVWKNSTFERKLYVHDKVFADSLDVTNSSSFASGSFAGSVSLGAGAILPFDEKLKIGTASDNHGLARPSSSDNLSTVDENGDIVDLDTGTVLIDDLDYRSIKTGYVSWSPENMKPTDMWTESEISASNDTIKAGSQFIANPTNTPSDPREFSFIVPNGQKTINGVEIYASPYNGSGTMDFEVFHDENTGINLFDSAEIHQPNNGDFYTFTVGAGQNDLDDSTNDLKMLEVPIDNTPVSEGAHIVVRMSNMEQVRISHMRVVYDAEEPSY